MTTHIATSAVLRVPPATPEDAASYFASRLTFHTDVSDVHAALSSGAPGFVLVDSRGAAAWAQGHIPGAVHLPTAQIPARAATLDQAVPVVTAASTRPTHRSRRRTSLRLLRPRRPCPPCARSIGP